MKCVLVYTNYGLTNYNVLTNHNDITQFHKYQIFFPTHLISLWDVNLYLLKHRNIVPYVPQHNELIVSNSVKFIMWSVGCMQLLTIFNMAHKEIIILLKFS